MEISKDKLFPDVSNKRVLEVGSYDVNGTIRKIFNGSKSYTGADLTLGPGVDIAMSGHELNAPDGSFDISLSCECFEHNPFWKATFSNMIRMTAPGGYVIMTCGSVGRIEHGTSRTTLAHSPGTAAVGINYYKNLGESDYLAEFDFATLFFEYRFWNIKSSCDLYFIGRVRGGVLEKTLTEDFSNSVVDLEKLSSEFRGRLRQFAFRIYRAPLDFVASRLSDGAYQNFAVRYDRIWSFFK